MKKKNKDFYFVNVLPCYFCYPIGSVLPYIFRWHFIFPADSKLLLAKKDEIIDEERDDTMAEPLKSLDLL